MSSPCCSIFNWQTDCAIVSVSSCILNELLHYTVQRKWVCAEVSLPRNFRPGRVKFSIHYRWSQVGMYFRAWSEHRSIPYDRADTSWQYQHSWAPCKENLFWSLSYAQALFRKMWFTPKIALAKADEIRQLQDHPLKKVRSQDECDMSTWRSVELDQLQMQRSCSSTNAEPFQSGSRPVQEGLKKKPNTLISWINFISFMGIHG